ncbi:hypothetical protein [Deferrisoma camini]|uniref:hypothetical protein n=1 Tax=Deferrisoma camini TaxID=1035120 RepID=UPI00146A4718|nr:hypothetical protein [Deferrisoma camini]
MDSEDQYAKLDEYAARRESEIRPMLQPYLDVTDQYGRLICRLSEHIGKRPPTSVQDAVIRDLMADVFDFLYEVRPFIVKGQTLVAYPLARRAYESLTLLQVCVLKESAAEKWNAGKKIKNEEIRKALGNNPIGESEEELRKLYRFFCDMTHPNRDTIPYRGLGEGNEFVFGSIGVPNLAVVLDYCLKHIDLWYWFCPVVAWFYKEILLKADPSFHDDHNQAREKAKQVTNWLTDQYNRVLEQYKNDVDVLRPKFI